MAFVTIKDKDDVTLGYLQTDAQERLGVHNFLHVQDQKPSAVSGGTFTSGAWRTRDLNQILINGITGASLVNNQITLPTGSYFVEAISASHYVGGVTLRLYDVTESVNLLHSLPTYVGVGSYDGAANASMLSILSGKIDLSQESVLELQHKCSTTYASYGLGMANGFDVPEVFSDLKIWKLS